MGQTKRVNNMKTKHKSKYTIIISIIFILLLSSNSLINAASINIVKNNQEETVLEIDNKTDNIKIESDKPYTIFTPPYSFGGGKVVEDYLSDSDYTSNYKTGFLATFANASVLGHSIADALIGQNIHLGKSKDLDVEIELIYTTGKQTLLAGFAGTWAYGEYDDWDETVLLELMSPWEDINLIEILFVSFFTIIGTVTGSLPALIFAIASLSITNTIKFFGELLDEDLAEKVTISFPISLDEGDHEIIGRIRNEVNSYVIGSALSFTLAQIPSIKIYGITPPDSPEIKGNSNGKPGYSYDFTFESNDVNGDDVRYEIDWGDGNSDTTRYYSESEKVTVSHTYNNIGDYEIVAIAEDKDEMRSDETYHSISIQYNNAPTISKLNGPTSVSKGTEYTYKITATDPNEDEVYILVKWGDGSNSGWKGPYESGEEVIFKHKWNIRKTYTIRVKAKDNENVESEYKELSVKVPKSKCSLFQLYNKITNQFPLLQRIINL